MITVCAALVALVACADDPTRPNTDALAPLTSASVGTLVPEDLGTLGSFGAALGINDEGSVVGYSLDASSRIRAFIWTSASGIQELDVNLGPGYTIATDINNRGQVVGYTEAGRAFLWTPGEGSRDLGTLGGDYAYANGMNDKGEVVGYSFTETGAPRAFLWTPTRGMIDLGAFVGDASGSFSSAHDVNDKGEVVGYSWTDGAHHAFLWTEKAGLRDLGTLGGPMSFAYGINNRSQIAGFAQTPEGHFHAFIWTGAAGMRDLGTLGGRESHAEDISETGEITGFSHIAGDTYERAFLWSEEGGMKDLGGGLSDSYSMGAAVNRRGQVAGYSFHPSGETRPTVWSRTPAGGRPE